VGAGVVKIPGGLDGQFRQLTPLFLLGVLAAIVFEPWVPGGAWLRGQFGDTAVLRACLFALGLYVLLLWGESLRLHTLLTGLLQAFRDFRGERAPDAARNPKARLEAARLLIAALVSDDPQIRATSLHNLKRLTGVDLGPTTAPWQQWLADQERASGS
jgi:hypothetical protein